MDIILQGIGGGFYTTSCFSVVPIIFRDSYIDRIAMLETSNEIGSLLGTSTGSLLYGVGRYSLPFYVYGGVMIIITIIIYKNIPND